MGKVAPGSRPKTFYLRSHGSPLSHQQKKSVGDGQAEQNEVKVTLFNRDDSYRP